MKTTILMLTIMTMFFLGTGNLEAQRRNDNPSNNRREADANKENSRRDNTQGVQKSQQNNHSEADRRTERDQPPVVIRRNKEPKHYPKKDVVIVTNRPERAYRDNHDDHVRIRYHDADYSYFRGRYYRINNGEYTIIAPPHGIRVGYIPEGCFTIMVERVPYYYYGGVYYRQNAIDRDYEVVVPPMGAIVPALPEDDVVALVIKGKTVFEYDNVLYKPLVTAYGVQYKVIGILDEDIN